MGELSLNEEKMAKILGWKRSQNHQGTKFYPDRFYDDKLGTLEHFMEQLYKILCYSCKIHLVRNGC